MKSGQTVKQTER